MSDKFYTVKELSDLLKVSNKTIRDTIAAGDIEAYKVGREWRISEEAVRTYLEANKNKK